jgi:hypothetical protein
MPLKPIQLSFGKLRPHPRPYVRWRLAGCYSRGCGGVPLRVGKLSRRETRARRARRTRLVILAAPSRAVQATSEPSSVELGARSLAREPNRSWSKIGVQTVAFVRRSHMNRYKRFTQYQVPLFDTSLLADAFVVGPEIDSPAISIRPGSGRLACRLHSPRCLPAGRRRPRHLCLLHRVSSGPKSAPIGRLMARRSLHREC